MVYRMTEWIECTLDKLGEIVGGATPSTKCEDYYGGSIPWITPKDLSSFKGRYITSGERNITEKGLASCSAQMMPKDAVLFTSRAPIGYVAIASQSVCTNQGFKLSLIHIFAMKIILDVLETTGITATAGIGTNLFLCKVAMDIVAKHIPADKNGVRIAELDEMKFRRELWAHQPLTDFWRVGRGIAKKLEQNGMFTMGDVALCSERNEDLLYKLFGKNAELLIDHAWGWEPTTIEAIKAYRPSSNSLSSGQVLHCPYEPQKAKLVVREMTDLLVLDLVDKGLVTDQMVLDVYKRQYQGNRGLSSLARGNQYVSSVCGVR